MSSYHEVLRQEVAQLGVLSSSPDKCMLTLGSRWRVRSRVQDKDHERWVKHLYPSGVRMSKDQCDIART